jgi:hypothetical protein
MANDDWYHEETDDTPSGGVLLGSQSLKCVGFNFCCTAADIAATLAASVALPADADDGACEGPAARATTGRTYNSRLAMAFRTRDSWHCPTSEFEQYRPLGLY